MIKINCTNCGYNSNKFETTIHACKTKLTAIIRCPVCKNAKMFCGPLVKPVKLYNVYDWWGVYCGKYLETLVITKEEAKRYLEEIKDCVAVKQHKIKKTMFRILNKNEVEK